MKNFLNSLRLTVWTADFAWKVLTFLVPVASGTLAGALTAGTQVFHSLGMLAWFGIALCAATLTALTMYLVRASQLAAAKAASMAAIATRSTRINPLHANFSDEVIHLSDLHLPGVQLHKHKQFRNCKFVGPGAIALLGSTLVSCGLNDVGDIVTIPDATIVGITVFEGCTFENCEFWRMTVVVRKRDVETFRKIPNVRVAT